MFLIALGGCGVAGRGGGERVLRYEVHSSGVTDADCDGTLPVAAASLLGDCQTFAKSIYPCRHFSRALSCKL